MKQVYMRANGSRERAERNLQSHGSLSLGLSIGRVLVHKAIDPARAIILDSLGPELIAHINNNGASVTGVGKLRWPVTLHNGQVGAEDVTYARVLIEVALTFGRNSRVLADKSARQLRPNLASPPRQFIDLAAVILEKTNHPPSMYTVIPERACEGVGSHLRSTTSVECSGEGKLI